MTHSRILYFDQTIAVAVVGPWTHEPCEPRHYKALLGQFRELAHVLPQRM